MYKWGVISDNMRQAAYMFYRCHVLAMQPDLKSQTWPVY